MATNKPPRRTAAKPKPSTEKTPAPITEELQAPLAPEPPALEPLAPQPPKSKGKKTAISDSVRAAFEKNPHVLTVWANEDQSVWYYRPKAGFTPIERNEL